MLFQGLLDLLLWIFDTVLDAFEEMSGLDLSVIGNTTIIAQFVAYMVQGARLMATYTHYQYLLSLLGIVIVIDSFFMAYKVIMWCLRKIPFVNID